MHARIQEVLTCLDDELARLRESVEAVPAVTRDRRPAPDRWSVAEVIEHLALVETSVLKACERQLAEARAAGLGAEEDSAPVRPLLPPERIASRERRITAPERVLPRGATTAAAAWADLEAVRARFRAFVVSCDGLALGDITFPHPALGPLSMYQWFLFTAGHCARHAAQIREIHQQLA